MTQCDVVYLMDYCALWYDAILNMKYVMEYFGMIQYDTMLQYIWMM